MKKKKKKREGEREKYPCHDRGNKTFTSTSQLPGDRQFRFSTKGNVLVSVRVRKVAREVEVPGKFFENVTLDTLASIFHVPRLKRNSRGADERRENFIENSYRSFAKLRDGRDYES